MAQLVVGLGNPGPDYLGSRHNIGHDVLDALGREFRARFRVRGQVALAQSAWEASRLFLAKPIAFMNESGPPVARLLRDLDLTPADLIVVHDDIDLPLGTVRIRHKGRHGGHNGVRSLIEALGTQEFRRVKIGVGRPAAKAEVVEWVLTTFSPEERQALPEIVDRAVAAVLGLARARLAAG
ncbi:MAG: aminoacyl-tRNA hydrolase [Candidatus Rokubacteria bacterium]|nr:aminoacyl-tRNA hydrolase [Candidatus Rokubacteria bacterium]MBI2878924.1 aminoacyl-tRNA hydrolase [Candidatus Rokubacteria bacterium]